MTVRHSPAGLCGSALLAGLIVAGCSVRVGKGGPPPDDGNLGNGVSACARTGNETKVPWGNGTEAFAFVWDTDHYVVVYVDPTQGNGDIFAAKLNADGTSQGDPVVVESTPAKSDLPSLLKTSAGYLVAWEEGTAGQGVLVHALGPDAAPTGNGVSVASTQAAQARPVLSAAPNGKVAASWMDTFDGKGGIQVALIDPSSLQVTGPQRVAQDDVDGWPWVAGDDQMLAVAWSDKASGPYDIQFAALDPQSLAASHQTSLRDNARNDALLPRMIRTGFGFLAAWEDMRGTDNQIYMALVDTGGNRIATGLVEEPNSGDANWPNATWSGSAAGIVYYQWRDNRPQIFMSFVNATGARVGGLHDVQVSNGSKGWSKYPDVVWTGKEFGVLYVDNRDGPPALYLQRVSCQG